MLGMRTDGTRTRREPSRAWYLVAVLGALLAVAGGALVLVLADDGLEDELRRMAMPGVASLPIEHPGEYTIYAEHPDLAEVGVDLLLSSTDPFDAARRLDVVVESRLGDPIQLRDPVGRRSYTFRESRPPYAHRSGEAIGRFRIPESGFYIVEATYPDLSEEPVVILAVAPGTGRTVLAMYAVGVGLPLVGIVCGADRAGPCLATSPRPSTAGSPHAGDLNGRVRPIGRLTGVQLVRVEMRSSMRGREMSGTPGAKRPGRPVACWSRICTAVCLISTLALLAAACSESGRPPGDHGGGNGTLLTDSGSPGHGQDDGAELPAPLTGGVAGDVWVGTMFGEWTFKSEKISELLHIVFTDAVVTEGEFSFSLQETLPDGTRLGRFPPLGGSSPEARIVSAVKVEEYHGQAGSIVCDHDQPLWDEYSWFGEFYEIPGGLAFRVGSHGPLQFETYGSCDASFGPSPLFGLMWFVLEPPSLLHVDIDPDGRGTLVLDYSGPVGEPLCPPDYDTCELHAHFTFAFQRIGDG
jgi:hypothetical protein